MAEQSKALEAYFKQRYPHVFDLADDLERVLTIFAASNEGYGEVTVKAQGLDESGALKVPDFITNMRIKRSKMQQAN